MTQECCSNTSKALRTSFGWSWAFANFAFLIPARLQGEVDVISLRTGCILGGCKYQLPGKRCKPERSLKER